MDTPREIITQLQDYGLQVQQSDAENQYDAVAHSWRTSTQDYNNYGYQTIQQQEIEKITDQIPDLMFSLKPKTNYQKPYTDHTKLKFFNTIDDLYAGKKPNLFGVKILDHSNMLSLLENMQTLVYLVENKVSKGLTNHLYVTALMWKKVVGWLENPALVFDSVSQNGARRLVFVSPETYPIPNQKTGITESKPIIMVVQPDGFRGDEQGICVNLNAYDLDNATSKFNKWAKEGNLRYINRSLVSTMYLEGRSRPQLAGLPRANTTTPTKKY